MISVFPGFGNGVLFDQIYFSSLTHAQQTETVVGDLNHDQYLDVLIVNLGIDNVGFTVEFTIISAGT